MQSEEDNVEESLLQVYGNRRRMTLAFVECATKNDVPTMRALADNGVSINTYDPRTGRNALHEAASNG